MNIYSIFLAMSAGICFSSGIKFLIIGFGLERKSKIHYYFAFMSILFGVYFLNSLLLFDNISTSSISGFVQNSKWGLMLFYFGLISQLLFIKEYTEEQIDLILKFVLGILGIIAISNLILPMTWIYTKVVFNYGNPTLTISPWYNIESFFTISLYAYFASSSTYRYYKSGNAQHAIFLGIGELLFLSSFISDVFLIQFNIIPYFLFAQVGLVTFVLIISLYQGYYIKRSEIEFERTVSLITEISKQYGEGITVADTNGNYIYTNQAYSNMTGYSVEEILHMTIYDFMVPDDEAILFNRVRKRGKGIREVELVKKDGSIFLSEISEFSVFLDNKNYILGVVRDITDKRQMELRLEESAKMEAIGRLAGRVAHDFNNILAGIIGYAQMSSMILDDKSEIKDYIERIIKASERGKNLINQILIYSRKDHEEQKPIIIGPVVKEAMEFLRASLPTTIKIITDFQLETDPVLIDATRFHEVVINLVTNAVDAIKDKGIIEVSVCDEVVKDQIIGKKGIVNPGHYSVLTVTDDGCGMNERIINNLFHPFFTTKERDKGTGMGLAVVYGIIHNSKGEILVYSELDKGSTFKIYLPKTHLTIKPEQFRNSEISKGSETILFIDDEEFVLESTTKILQTLGYIVHSFTDPSKALNFFKEQHLKIDLIITDQTMPQTTGFDLAQEFLKIHPKIPIILITGYSKDLTKEEVLNSGIRLYLKKPFDTIKLCDSIREALTK